MPMPRFTPRERRALLLSPLAAPIGYWLGLLAVGVGKALMDPATNYTIAPVRMLGMTLAVGAPIACGAMALVGLPAYLLLRGAGRTGRLALWAAGGAIGAAVAMLLRPSLRGELFSIPFPVWSGVVLGLATAEVFVRLLGGSGGRPTDAGAAG